MSEQQQGYAEAHGSGSGKGTPQEAQRQWAKLVSAGDLEAVLELFEDDAAIAVQPGQVVNGIDAVRGTMQTLIGMEAKFTLQDPIVAESGDVALLLTPWTATARGPEGPMNLAGTTSDVLVRGSDGVWRIKIDNPYGTAS